MILSPILHAQNHISMDRCEYASPQNMLATLNYNMSLYMHTTVEDTCYIISWMLLHLPTTIEYLCYILLRMSLNMQTNVVHACYIILGMLWYRHSTVVCCCCIFSFTYVCVCVCVCVCLTAIHFYITAPIATKLHACTKDLLGKVLEPMSIS